MTIRRLSVYTRCLLQLEEDGVKTVSSQELAERFSLNSAQVRKDLAYFGEFGVRGIGYYVSGLKAELQRILGLDREWAVALVGFGNLGSALFHYRGFGRQGFRIAAIFDDDPAKVGREVDATPVFASRDLGREVKARGIQIAIVAVPPEAAQAVNTARKSWERFFISSKPSVRRLRIFYGIRASGRGSASSPRTFCRRADKPGPPGAA